MPSALDLCAAPNLSYFRKQTTDKGIWQHGKGQDPDQGMGYSIDDVARALIVVNRVKKVFPELDKDPNDPRSLADLAAIYLNYIEKNQLEKGGFHNFDSLEGTPLDQVGSEDSFGRTVWALGDTIKNGVTSEQIERADRMFEKASGYMVTQEFVRTNCFIILGIVSAVAHERNPARYQMLRDLTQRTVDSFRKESVGEWLWFESSMSYSNGAIPLALLRAATALKKTDPQLSQDAKDTALAALQFLLKVTQHDNKPAPVGNRGWFERGKQKALYDQQPVDAAAKVLACLEAWQVTGEEPYKNSAESWLRWYEGNNVVGKPLLLENGAVRDGINEGGWINENCGAESVVTYLLARLRWAELVCRK